MKRFAQSLLLFCCAATAFAQTPAKPVGQNLVFEGNFAEHNLSIPVGWNEGGYAGGTHGNTTKVTEERDGNYVSLFIKKTETANFCLNLTEPILLKPTWKSLLCSVDIRAFNHVSGEKSYHRPRLHISFLDEAGKELSDAGVSLTGRYTDAWQTAERNVPIPMGAVSAKIWIGTLGSTGQIDFRNPYVAPVE
jgi:hypothetical protein